MKPEILDFFQYKNKFKLNYKITNRILGIQAFFRGDLSFRDTVSFVLPGRMSPNRKLIWERMLAKYINDDGSVTLFGKPFFAPYKKYGDLVVFIQQIIVDDQYQVNKLLQKDFVIIDGGANMGVFSIFAAHKYPESIIYSFEPTPETFKALQKNASFYSNIKAFQLALGEVKTQREFQIYFESSGSNHFTSENFMGHGSETVQASITTIDDFVNENMVSQINFIKLDTEGYESNIIKGATESIKKWNPMFVMAAYHGPSDKEELPKLLRSINQNYYCEVHKDNEEDLVCYVK